MIKVGIIGCGKMADQHAAQIQKLPDCRIAGVCDREELMAKQMYERFQVENYFTDVNMLLETVRPNIIHITTPPQSHFKLGKMCLEAGCNVYIEKPFTVDIEEAEKLIGLAKEKNLKLTVGHNVQFMPTSIRMRKLVREGFLGGPPIHMESYYCYNLSDPGYAKALIGDHKHWVRSLPGKLLQNIISHGISKIAEFLPGDFPKVIANGYTSPLLKSIEEKDIIDELRVMIYDKENVSAYFTFSSQLNPVLHQFRVYGLKNSIIVDDDHQTLIKVDGGKYKSYLDQFIPPVVFAKKYLANAGRNISKFIKNDFHNDAGMKNLIKAFYQSVMDGKPLPIPYREIILTTRIMDDIFNQINR